MTGQEKGIQAVLLAGDRRAARAVAGHSKAFVPVAGRPMLVHVLESLLHTPEVSEVFVVGDPVRLEKTLGEHGLLDLAASRGRPVHVLPQRETLYENVWHAFLRALPPGEQDPDHAILVVPSDIPLVVPEEISEFVRRARASGVDYVIGISPESALLPYAPRDGEPGIRMASFNVREGRFRQNNLHFVRPLRMSKRHLIEDMYESRYQKQLGNMLRLGWQILRQEYRHLWVVFYYVLMHVAAVLDRRGYRRAADRVRARIPIQRIELGIGQLLGTRFGTVETGLGGAALDVDNDEDLAVVDKMLPAWKERQARLARESSPGPDPPSAPEP
jgi:GTP:adenosylcobinamide-phosphate guanylyltransferase